MRVDQVTADTALIREQRSLIDVRAPIEFAKGALPNAVNLPLMDDDERHAVGTAYQQQGQAAAIALGERRVSGDLKAARIEAWRTHLEQHPDALIYCFRGGLRSRIAQQWLAEVTGIQCPRIEGGWKAMRQALMCRTEAAARQPMVIIAGLTGCAKTDLIKALPSGVDLEGFARHKGSAFGRSPTPPPAQIDFEHALAERLLTLPGPLVVEDESRQIGSVNIPLPFFEAMAQAPRIRVEMPLDWRLAQLIQDYILELENAYQALYGSEEGWQRMQQHLSNALLRLAKRLGKARLQRLQRLQALSFAAHETGNRQAHEAWLAPLLTEYYDPLYRRHMQRQQETAGELLHAGDWQSCLEAAQTWEKAAPPGPF